jgi:hypothetical protein
LPERRPTLTALAAPIAAGILSLGFAAGCGSSSPHKHATAGGFVRPPLESIFEDEHLLHTNPAHAFAVMRRLGVDRMRVYVGWGYIAPDPQSRTRPTAFNAADPAAYPAATMAVYDAIVREAASQGVGIDMTVGGPAPLWGAGHGAPPRTPPQYQAVWKPSAPDFGQFVRAIASRYDGHYKPPGASAPLPRVGFWSVWNEPNYGPDLAPQATDHSTVEVSPALYRGLLDAAWSALQATAHGHDTILIGETAPRGQTTGDQPGNFSGMVPLRFIRALYCIDDTFTPLQGAEATARGCPSDAAGSQQFATAHPALFEAGGFADHPYPQGQIAPNVPTPDEPDYADLAALPNLEHTLDRARAAYGSHPMLPIYSTEFGFQTDPPETLSRAIDPVKAAYYMNWSEYLSWRNPRLLSYDQYLLTDPPGASSLGGFATGLQFSNGTPKATYQAYVMPLYLPLAQTKRGQAIEVWGDVRPAHYAQLTTHSSQRVRVQFRPNSAQSFQTLKTVTLTNQNGYFDTAMSFDQTGTLRLAWSYPHGPTIYSRPVTVTVL